ncbi:uncharacterized protein DSM5745_05969 [Aspergillus mulundensis]|uniref:SMODS and SLOG-associating 2TM effector domain-containing protein n=1 Tax=Aspergillus mulundensis TaxID=1810919 RepID=A0A3D8RYI1_9EURO|nr:Uncharacterized protein DSM5745_05969 [Aspergillus mulundensis]RDW79117.1 Uncharacterized protein DSM5745_05969 [Aspergillus mulundensis]
MPDSSNSKNGTSPPKHDIFRAATSALYKRLRVKERHKTSHNHLFSIAFNTLSILQLIIGATITGLGPISDNHSVAVTVLGAVNTVIAGVLALMKGRGLPQRLRKDLAEIRKVLSYIDEVDVDLRYGEGQRADGDGNGDVTALIKEAFARYQVMQEVIDMNQPDSYVNAPQLERSGQLRRDHPGDEEMA